MVYNCSRIVVNFQGVVISWLGDPQDLLERHGKCLTLQRKQLRQPTGSILKVIPFNFAQYIYVCTYSYSHIFLISNYITLHYITIQYITLQTYINTKRVLFFNSDDITKKASKATGSSSDQATGPSATSCRCSSVIRTATFAGFPS